MAIELRSAYKPFIFRKLKGVALEHLLIASAQNGEVLQKISRNWYSIHKYSKQKVVYTYFF